MASVVRRLGRVLGLPPSKYPEIARLAENIRETLSQLAGCEELASAVFRKQLRLRLRDLSEKLERLAEGRLIFDSTETWRTVYEEVLQSCQPHRYLSVALIRSDDYWRDAPGERSLKFNYELLAHGFHVHRIFVIDEFFWPKAARVPSTQLFHWIKAQHRRGIEVSLLRLADLDDEPNLACDMGIYGSEAVGWQQTDFEGRTVRFELSFDKSSVAEAEQRWNQLLLYARPLDETVNPG